MCVCVMPLHATCSALARVASATSARPGGVAAPFRCALEASFAGSGGWEEAVALQGGVPGQAVLRLHQLSSATISAARRRAPPHQLAAAWRQPLAAPQPRRPPRASRTRRRRRARARSPRAKRTALRRRATRRRRHSKKNKGAKQKVPLGGGLGVGIGPHEPLPSLADSESARTMARSVPSVRDGQILRSFRRPHGSSTERSKHYCMSQVPRVPSGWHLRLLLNSGILFVAAEGAQEEAGDAHEDSRVSQSTSKAGDAFGGVGGPEARRSPRRRVR